VPPSSLLKVASSYQIVTHLCSLQIVVAVNEDGIIQAFRPSEFTSLWTFASDK
jgi:hypothetical protein